jgi:hypothetical protein
MLERFDAMKENTVIGMEATGHYWLNVYSYLLELGYNLKVINPIQSEAFRKMYIRKTKNDSKDSFVIAQIMRFGQFSTTALSDENIIALRQLSRYRVNLVDSCSDWKRKVIALVDQVFPEYESFFSDTFGVTSKEILLKYPTPEDMLSVGTKKLTSLLEKSSRGRFKSEKANEIKDCAKKSFGVKFAKDAFAFQIKQMIAQIIFIEEQLAQLELEISTRLKETNQVITTIIGTQNKLSKRGSPYLRRAIWTAANRAAFTDPALSEYYQSLRSRGKHHLTAIGAVARKLCNLIFAVLRDNKPYVPIVISS